MIDFGLVNVVAKREIRHSTLYKKYLGTLFLSLFLLSLFMFPESMFLTAAVDRFFNITLHRNIRTHHNYSYWLVFHLTPTHPQKGYL